MQNVELKTVNRKLITTYYLPTTISFLVATVSRARMIDAIAMRFSIH
jgi:hypothetical protein